LAFGPNAGRRQFLEQPLDKRLGAHACLNLLSIIELLLIALLLRLRWGVRLRPEHRRDQLIPSSPEEPRMGCRSLETLTPSLLLVRRDPQRDHLAFDGGVSWQGPATVLVVYRTEQRHTKERLGAGLLAGRILNDGSPKLRESQI